MTYDRGVALRLALESVARTLEDNVAEVAEGDIEALRAYTAFVLARDTRLQSRRSGEPALELKLTGDDWTQLERLAREQGVTPADAAHAALRAMVEYARKSDEGQTRLQIHLAREELGPGAEGLAE
jgi:hypothetical protein